MSAGSARRHRTAAPPAGPASRLGLAPPPARPPIGTAHRAPGSGRSLRLLGAVVPRGARQGRAGRRRRRRGGLRFPECPQGVAWRRRMTPEFDEEVVFEVGAGATWGGLGPCLSAPLRGVAPRSPGAVCARRPEVPVGREAGSGPGQGPRAAGGGGREPAGPAGRGGARRDGAGCPTLRSSLGTGVAPRPSAQAEGGSVGGRGSRAGEGSAGKARSFVRRPAWAARGGWPAPAVRAADVARSVRKEHGGAGGPCRRVFVRPGLGQPAGAEEGGTAAGVSASGTSS